MPKITTSMPDDPDMDKSKLAQNGGLTISPMGGLQSEHPGAMQPKASSINTGSGYNQPPVTIPSVTGQPPADVANDGQPIQAQLNAQPSATELKDARTSIETVPAAKHPAITSAADKLKNILLPASFGGIGVVYKPTVSLFERPANNCWFRVHLSTTFDVLTFKSRDKKTRYVADFTNAPLVAFLASRNAGRPTRCYPYMLNDGTLGFWPAFLDGVNGKPLDGFNQSAHIIAEQAKTSWKAIITGGDSYKVATAPNEDIYGEPHWPEDLATEFTHAIEGVLVANLDHPEMKYWAGLQ